MYREGEGLKFSKSLEIGGGGFSFQIQYIYLVVVSKGVGKLF